MAKSELEIVREFLERNNLVHVVELLQQAVPHGAKATKGAQVVRPNETTTATFDGPQWDSDGYFDADQPTRLTVPTALRGRYFIQVAIRWLNDADVTPDSYYHAFLSVNGSSHPAGNDARSTANDTEAGATGTTQHFTFETNLGDGDYVELHVWQGFGSDRRCDLYFQMRRVGG